MAAVVTAKAPATASKMKKPSLPAVQTNNHASRQNAPSSSPSSASKRLPGQTTPLSSTMQSNSTTNAPPTNTNGPARPNRRLQRLTTRTGINENVPLDKKAAAKKFAAPYVSSESYILKKFKNRPPSLIVHLHPTHFRFDQQDGSFGYQSEMRIFIEHLRKKTIPHDMLEEFRKSDVQFYDGWLIVRVIDHKTVAANSSNSAGESDGSKPFSIHNHNNFITPSPYAPHSAKDSRPGTSPAVKQERQGSIGKESLQNGTPSDDTVEAVPKSSRSQPQIYHLALRPTQLSMHMDIALDAIAPDPKTLNRKQSNQPVSRTPASGQPPTPVGTIPSTPVAERPPPFKRQKLKIDPKDLLEYESRVVNATAPPLFLDAVESYDEAMQLLDVFKDSWHDQAPPSPKSRKRTVAELAADVAQAKELEKFMLIMDERGAGNTNLANATGVDSQAGTASFQPRFEKFNVLDQIKRDLEEKKQREKERQLQEDEARRGQQQQEEERRKVLQMQAIAERRRQAQAQNQAQTQAQGQTPIQTPAQVQAQTAGNQRQQQQQQQQQQAQAQAVQAQAQAQAQAQVQQNVRAQPNRIPPQMQGQITAAQASSPVIRQGTPQQASSPVVAVGSHPMAVSGSQGQAGSPPRPGSALQHAHPAASMVRGPSAQGPSRNGTPQLTQETPSMRNATPVIRQGTPSQHMSHASPHGSMAAPTPQIGHAGMVGPSPQMANGMPQTQMTPQMADLRRRQQQHQQQQAMQQAMQQQQLTPAQMANITPAQMANIRAQQQAQHQMALHQQQQQQHAMQQGTPQGHHMSPNPSQAAYKASMAEKAKNHLQNLQGQNQGSPAPNQLTPMQQQQFQQQMQQARILQQQQQQQQMQQQQQNGQIGQQQMGQRPPMNPQNMQQQLQALAQKIWQTQLQQAAQKYGGNASMIPPQEQHQLQQMAQTKARQIMMAQQQKQQQQVQMLQQQRQAMAQGGNPMQNAGMNQMNPAMAAQMQQHQNAQQMQAMRMQHAQSMMAQQQAQGNLQQQYQQQMADMQNMMQGGQR